MTYFHPYSRVTNYLCELFFSCSQKNKTHSYLHSNGKLNNKHFYSINFTYIFLKIL